MNNTSKKIMVISAFVLMASVVAPARAMDDCCDFHDITIAGKLTQGLRDLRREKTLEKKEAENAHAEQAEKDRLVEVGRAHDEWVVGQAAKLAKKSDIEVVAKIVPTAVEEVAPVQKIMGVSLAQHPQIENQVPVASAIVAPPIDSANKWRDVVEWIYENPKKTFVGGFVGLAVLAGITQKRE
jgi:hypothetical protein